MTTTTATTTTARIAVDTFAALRGRRASGLSEPCASEKYSVRPEGKPPVSRNVRATNLRDPRRNPYPDAEARAGPILAGNSPWE